MKQAVTYFLMLAVKSMAVAAVVLGLSFAIGSLLPKLFQL